MFCSTLFWAFSAIYNEQKKKKKKVKKKKISTNSVKEGYPTKNLLPDTLTETDW